MTTLAVIGFDAHIRGHESSETTKRYYGRLTVDDVLHKIAAVDW